MGRPEPSAGRVLGRVALAAALLGAVADARAAAPPPARFPQPQFESGYSSPKTTVPPPRAWARECADVAALAAALAAGAWLARKRRSRAGLVALAAASIAYFGFYRRGCVCPVGSIQNVASALADPAFAIPWTVVLFFLLPLLFAALYGRVFCGSVCPLGAIQELAQWRAMRVPAWLDAPLRLLPPLYLGLAVLLAATGADYIICRFDPFIGFYRLGGSTAMLLTGAAFLLAGLLVARPYCRYLCPYGVLLGWVSRFAYRPATVTPAGCINCRLCERACPHDFIRVPEPVEPGEPRAKARRRLAAALTLAPLLVLLGAAAGYAARLPVARLHPQFRLAERVAMEERGLERGFTVESEAFRQHEGSVAALAREADRIRVAAGAGSATLGGFMGLLIGARIVGLARRPARACYELEAADCFACARCFAACPVKADAEGIAHA